MTSKIKVDNINKVSDDSNIIKKCGSTITMGSGACNPIVVDGSAVTLGRCGGTVALASGATQTGFGRTGTVDWQTSSIKTSTFTAANGEGYFANTSGGAFTMNLPAGSAGDIISVVDYTNSFQDNALTIAANGSEKIGGIAATVDLTTEGQSVTFVYVDAVEGWKNTMDSTSNVTGAIPFMSATVSGTGNTLATAPDCANTKIATFTGPGSFVVSASTNPANNVVSHLVLGGGGSGGGGQSGGGGAGGFREVAAPSAPYSASPLNGYPASPLNAITVSTQTYPITVGAGGAAISCAPTTRGNNGGVSTFSSINSAGGGGGGANSSGKIGADGGSGGGGTDTAAGGTGNTPPVSPAQGKDGGDSSTPSSGGGGGGANAAGSDASVANVGANGGNGIATSISASPVTYAGGGGGAGRSPGGPTTPQGGSGGGGNGNNNGNGVNGTVNLGGGGGGCENTTCRTSGAGGSGIVIIRYKFQ